VRHLRQLRLRPAWASFFAPAQWERFLMAVAHELSTRQLPFIYLGGTMQVTLANGQNAQLGLGNLAQICHQVQEREWRELIAHHFNIVLDGMQDDADAEALLTDFSKVQPQLFVRLISLESISRENLAVARNDIPGLISYLAVDLPSTVRSISAGEIEPWGKMPGELYEIALNNVRTKSVTQVERFTAETGIELITVSGEDFFVASHTLLLHEHPDWLGAYGSLLIIPTRHTFLVYPINDMLFTRAIQYLAMMATGMEQEGPGSITRKMYWYADGQYVEIPYTCVKTKVEVTPPPEFITLMNRIAEEQGVPAKKLF
jgi:hypothetical protein